MFGACSVSLRKDFSLRIGNMMSLLKTSNEPHNLDLIEYFVSDVDDDDCLPRM